MEPHVQAAPGVPTATGRPRPAPSAADGGARAGGPHGTPFEEPWWLDAVAPGCWDAVEVAGAGGVRGRMPFVATRRMGLRVAVNPPLTPTLGPWTRPVEGGFTHRLTEETEVLGALIDALPRLDLVRQRLPAETLSWLPYHWRGFRATVRYTYRLDDLGDLARVWQGFRQNVRRNVRAAERRFEVVRGGGVGPVLDLTRQTFARQDEAGPPDDLVERLDDAAAARGAREIVLAIDASGRPAAVAYLILGRGTAYYLLGGQSDEAYRAGGPSLVMWHAIRRAAAAGCAFDFEGSMIPGVERFFRSFGGRLVPLVEVSRTSRRASGLLALRRAGGRRGGGP